MDEKLNLVADSWADRVEKAVRWTEKFKASGAGVTFTNTPEGASLSIVRTKDNAPRVTGDKSFWAIIDSSEREGSDRRWSYVVKRVGPKTDTQWDGWAALSGTDTLPAYNSLDVMQAGSGAAIPDGTPVRVWPVAVDGEDTEYWFTANGTEVFLPVLVTVDAGDAGDSATDCTFTYTLKSLAGVTLATGKTPKRPRYPSCEYDEPTADSIGQAYYDVAGDLQLYEAVEEKPAGFEITYGESIAWDDDAKKVVMTRRKAFTLADRGEAEPSEVQFFVCPTE